MIIRIALLLALNSVIVLILADIAARLSFSAIASILTDLGVTIMLSAFALLVVKGLLTTCKTIMLSTAEYFSWQNRKQRRQRYLQAKQNQLNRLFYFKALQIRYFTQQKISKLLTKNNRQQLQSLSKSIQTDLRSRQKNIPVMVFKQLQHENKVFLNQQNKDALLKLQQKISTLTDYG
jgi:hypothetical protein